MYFGPALEEQTPAVSSGSVLIRREQNSGDEFVNCGIKKLISLHSVDQPDCSRDTELKEEMDFTS